MENQNPKFENRLEENSETVNLDALANHYSVPNFDFEL